MKYSEEQWLEKSDEIKARSIQNELNLVTHNGTTRDDLLMMLKWQNEQLKNKASEEVMAYTELLEEAAEEIENCYGKDTPLTIRIRDFIKED